MADFQRSKISFGFEAGNFFFLGIIVLFPSVLFLYFPQIKWCKLKT